MNHDYVPSNPLSLSVAKSARASQCSIIFERQISRKKSMSTFNLGMCVTMAGSWWHCGYHLTTSIVAPALLSLPFALSLLGWVAGVFCLTMAALVTFYSYNLLSVVLEHHAHLGQRQLRFRDMARDILGGWQLVCYNHIMLNQMAPLSVIYCSILKDGQFVNSGYLF